jgi:hypothetical protein
MAFVALCAVMNGVPKVGYAELVVKMSMSASPTGNMGFGSGLFAMLPDGNPATDGDRDMKIAYLFDPEEEFSSAAAIDDGSVSLAGMTASAPPFSNASFMVQAFNSGNIEIFGPANELLLKGDLNTSGLQGALGTPNPQALFWDSVKSRADRWRTTLIPIPCSCVSSMPRSTHNSRYPPNPIRSLATSRPGPRRWT